MYLQLSTLMRRRISVGEWPQDMRLPALEELMQEFGVARVTVRQALALLEAEGLVTRKQGRGTFVTGSPEERHWFGLATSWDALIRIIEGTQPSLLRLAEGVRLPPVAASEGRPAPAYRQLKRIHAKDDVPFCIIAIYLHHRNFDKAPARRHPQTVH